MGAGPVPPYGPILTAQCEPLYDVQFLSNQECIIHFASSILVSLGINNNTYNHVTVSNRIILLDQA